jgi:hypothetical protein
MSERAPVAKARKRVCIDCRSVLADGETCAPKHRVADLATNKGRESLLDEVWGPPTFRRQFKRLAKAGGGGATAGGIANGCDGGGCTGCDASGLGLGEAAAAILFVIAAALIAVVVVWLLYKGIRLLRDYLNRPKPHGAVAPPPLARGGALAGVVEGDRERSDTPASDDASVGYALEYSASRVVGGAVMLIDSATRGFDVKLDDGRRVRVAPGTIRLVADRHALGGGERELAASHLDAIDPARTRVLDAENPTTDAFPYDTVRESLLRVGDRVEVTCGVESMPDPDAAEGGYRGAARSSCRRRSRRFAFASDQ